jgi:hypothetical protein
MGVLALLVVAAGCGSDGDDSSLTKAEFVKQADAICARQDGKKNKALEKAFGEGAQGNPQKAQEKIIADVALPPIAEMSEELADLGGPSGEEEKAEEMVEAFEEEVEKIEADIPGTVAGKVGNFDKASKLAKDFGMKACAQI